MASEIKAEIGFGIGQVLAVKLTEGDLKKLRKEVESGSGWYDVSTPDGTVALNLATVVFIRVADTERGIGFSG